MRVKWSFQSLRRPTVLVILTMLAAACGGGGTTDGGEAEPTTQAEAGADASETAEAPGAAEPATLTVAVQGNFVPTNIVYIADELGYFEDENLTIEFISTQATNDATTGILGGSVDVMLVGPDFIIANEQGADLISVGATSNVAIWDIVTAPEITSWDQLGGASLAVSGVESISTIAFKLAAEAAGIDPDSVELVTAGSTRDRYAALTSGQVDAATVGNPFGALAVEEGYTNLGAAASDEEAPPLLTGVFGVSRAWAEGEGSDELVRFLRAMLRATEYAYQPENLDSLAEMAATIMETEAEYTRPAWEDVLATDGLLPPDLRVDPDAVITAAEAFVEFGSLNAVPDTDVLIDHSYLEMAEAG